MDDKVREEIVNRAYLQNRKYSVDVFYERMFEVYNRAIRKKW